MASTDWIFHPMKLSPSPTFGTVENGVIDNLFGDEKSAKSGLDGKRAENVIIGRPNCSHLPIVCHTRQRGRQFRQ